MIRHSGKLIPLKVEEIDWIKGAGVYAQLHAQGKKYLIRESLRRIEESLDPREFTRIHRSYIINVDRVREVWPQWRGEFYIILQDGTKLKMSRSYRSNLSAIGVSNLG